MTHARLNGADPLLFGLLELISDTPTLGPELNLCPCNVPTTIPPPHQSNKKGKQVLGVGTLEGRELPGENT